MPTATLYYEAHVTIDPVFDLGRVVAEEAAKQRGFRLAKLFMRKDVEHRDDTFMTAHGKDLEDIQARTVSLVRDLQELGFVVRRYKIEDTILDSRTADIFNLLGG